MKPKILIGCPAYEGHFYCLGEWVKNVKSFDFPNFDIILVDNSKGSKYFNRIKRLGMKCLKSEYHPRPNIRLAKAREKLHNYAIKNRYDYLFSVEQDIFPKRDVLKKLILDQKDIVAAPFILEDFLDEKLRRRKDWLVSFSGIKKYAVTKDGVKRSLWYLESELKKLRVKLFQVKNCTFGCTLIKTDILKKIKTRIDPRLNKPDDAYFFKDCRKAGIRVYIDTSLYGKVEHYRRMGTGFGWVVEKGINKKVRY
jgi:hypothetical protein